MIKKLIGLFIVSSIVFTSLSFADNHGSLKSKVISQIKTQYKAWMNKYENGEMKKEEVNERLRNMVRVLREMHGDKLSDEFYKKMRDFADKINTINQKEQTKQSQAKAMESSEQAKEQAKEEAQKKAQEAKKQHQVSDQNKQKIDAVLGKFFGKFSKLKNQVQINKMNKVLDKIQSKKSMVENMQNETAKSKLMGILNYLETKFENKLQELK